jgi:hypothetical protein
MLLLDQLADPRQRPQSAQVSELLGPLLEALFELRYLGFVQFRRPPCAWRPAQTAATSAL